MRTGTREAQAEAPETARNQRLGSISGRYEGDMTAPTPASHWLALRVDVDERYANSPVLDRISGDIFQVHHIVLPGRKPDAWRVYRESWVVDQPVVDRDSRPGLIVITGTARFYK